MKIPGYRGDLPWLGERTVLLTRHGSHAYGTNTPTSDVDIKGVAIPPKSYTLGVFQRFEQAECKEPDLVIYDLRKFVQLAGECNPNIIEVLFTESSDWLGVTPLGEKLIAARGLFVSRKARFTFSGYAMAQLRRLRNHHRWVKDPPSEPPSRAGFGLAEDPPGMAEQMTAALSEIQKLVESWTVDLSSVSSDEQERLRDVIARAMAERQLAESGAWDAAARSLRMDSNMIDTLKREREFRARFREWEQYLHWRKTRNQARSELETRFGYDTKFGMHTVRLLRMAKEILETGVVHVKRPDAEELLSIRNGAWSFEKLDAWATDQDAALESVYKASLLPHSANKKAIDALCVELLEASLRDGVLDNVSTKELASA